MQPPEDQPAKARIRVLFDATRLIARAGFGTPTGIDRVDLAYARALSAAVNFDLQLLMFDRIGPHLLKPQTAQRVIETAASNWQSVGSAVLSTQFANVRTFLASPAGTARPQTAAAPTPSSNGNRLNRWRLTLGRTEGALALRRSRIDAGRRPTVYVNTSHGHLFRSAASRWLAPNRIASVFMIHDLIPLEVPEFNRGAEAGRHAARLRTVATHASSVIVNSSATRDALLNYLHSTQQRVPPVEAIPLGIDPCFGAEQPATGLQPALPYFVTLSTIEPRKNHLLLLQIWRRLVELHGDNAPRLLLIGRRGWENQTVFNILDRSSLLSRHVVECSGFGDHEIAALIRHSRALLSPSFAEGYGLPVTEALALGAPVIASDIPAHREVGSQGAEFLDPLDGIGWLRAINDYSTDSPRRNAALERLKAHVPTSWDTHFDKALTLIEQAARNPARA